jgi:ribosomal 50S subunit-recycling heat shock protein
MQVRRLPAWVAGHCQRRITLCQPLYGTILMCCPMQAHADSPTTAADDQAPMAVQVSVRELGGKVRPGVNHACLTAACSCCALGPSLAVPRWMCAPCLQSKVRLDAYLTSKLPDTSRARIAASIKAGLVGVNGRPCCKPAAGVRPGDAITAQLLPPEPCTVRLRAGAAPSPGPQPRTSPGWPCVLGQRLGAAAAQLSAHDPPLRPPPPPQAEPEAIPLDVVYEDEALLVVNKAAGMVVHISPGHTRGTLVNALLAHCGLPAMDVASGSAPHAGLLGGGWVGGWVSGQGSTAAHTSTAARQGAGRCMQRPECHR